MKAKVGDMIVIRGHRVGEPDREGEVLEVHGADGTPPWVVRWDDGPGLHTFFPGPDAEVVHLGDKKTGDKKTGD